MLPDMVSVFPGTSLTVPVWHGGVVFLAVVSAVGTSLCLLVCLKQHRGFTALRGHIQLFGQTIWEHFPSISVKRAPSCSDVVTETRDK